MDERINGHTVNHAFKPPIIAGDEAMGPSHGERLATLEAVQSALATDVGEVRKDIKILSGKVDLQYQDLKTTYLTQSVQTSARAAVWASIWKRVGWFIAQAVIIGAAILGGSSLLHVR